MSKAGKTPTKHDDWIELPPELEKERLLMRGLYKQMLSARLEMIATQAQYQTLMTTYSQQREHWNEVFAEHRRLRDAKGKE